MYDDSDWSYSALTLKYKDWRRDVASHTGLQNVVTDIKSQKLLESPTHGDQADFKRANAIQEKPG